MTIEKSKRAAADNASGEAERVTSPTSSGAGTRAEGKATTRRPRRMAREAKARAASTCVPADAEVESAALSRMTSTPAEPRQTKSAAVLALLQRNEGATLDQLVEATGWLPHTARAALTGLKKKGHVITSSKAAGQPRVYRAGQA